MTTTYQMCTRCVMDTSDPNIVFDADGVCNHCHTYAMLAERQVRADDPEALPKLIDEVKRAGQGREYDCVIGVSGGVDSTYVAYKLKELGLRPLAVHLDNGWDSELAVHNIEKTLKIVGIELYTYVIDWEEFRDLQLAFLKASTPDSEIPTDHAIMAILYRTAARLGVRYVISGHNVRTEAVLPSAWSHGHYDWKYIRSVQKQFGTRKLESFPRFSLARLFWWYGVRRMKLINVLNYFHYDKAEALGVLREKLQWQEYGGKHHESIYTRFFQGYILPKKFGYDKRRAHLSALICAGQLEREAALEELKGPVYDEQKMAEDKRYVVKKFMLTEEEFDRIMALPKKQFADYPSYELHWLWRYPYWVSQRIPKLGGWLKSKLRQREAS